MLLSGDASWISCSPRIFHLSAYHVLGFGSSLLKCLFWLMVFRARKFPMKEVYARVIIYPPLSLFLLLIVWITWFQNVTMHVSLKGWATNMILIRWSIFITPMTLWFLEGTVSLGPWSLNGSFSDLSDGLDLRLIFIRVHWSFWGDIS